MFGVATGPLSCFVSLFCDKPLVRNDDLAALDADASVGTKMPS